MRHCPNCGTKFTNQEAFCPYDGTPTAADTKDNVDPWVGVVVDSRYRIESRIGEGGMGIVYAATHVLLNKRIAIKVVRADHAKDGEVAERFMQEARAATSIGHPNIIDINDFGRMPDGSVYFAMEFLNGSGLDQLMEKGTLPMEEAIHIIEQMGSALGAAHERGIVHRDLKPDNVFLIKHREDTRFVKVLDFGIAKVAGGSSRTTRAGMVFGTPHYMSPEQAAGQSVDHRADIYALGVMMYEMFTGQLPFDAETFMGVLTMHMYEAPPPPSQISPEVAERIGDLEGVVLRALSKKPELRYQSMAELCEDMKLAHSGGRRSAGLAQTLFPANSLAPTLPPPPDAVIDPTPGFSDAFDSAAADLMSDTGGQLETTLVPQSPARMRWVAAAGAAVVVCGLLVVLIGGGGEADGAVDPAGATANTNTKVDGKANVVAPSVPTDTPPTSKDKAHTVEVVPEKKTIEISSSPLGAQVLHDGALLGSTPLTLAVPTDGHLDVQVTSEGHVPALLHLTPTSPARIVASLALEPPKPTKRAVASTTTPRQRPPATEPTSPAKKPAKTGTMRDMVDPWNE